MVEKIGQNNAAAPLTPDEVKQQRALAAGRTVIGIYPGSSSVSVVQTAVYQGRSTLINVAVEAVVPAGNEERSVAVARALRKALAGFDTRRADVVCVMPGRQTLTENMLMPPMPPEEIAEAIRLEVANSRDFTVADPVFDFYVAGPMMDGAVQKTSVITAATSKIAVEELLAGLMPSSLFFWEKKRFDRKVAPVGVEVSAIIPFAVAFENLVRSLPQYTEEIVAVLEIGSIGTELNIYRNGCFDFSRQIPVSGFDFTRSLTGALFTDKGKVSLSIEEAEAIKEEYGIPSPVDTYLINNKISAGQVLSLLRPKLEQFSGEIYRSFDHYRQKTHAGRVDRLVIFGGGARLKGLVGFLEADLGLPVLVGDPLENVAMIAPGLVRSEDRQRLSLAVGASLWNGKGINLLPPVLQHRKKRLWTFVLAVALAAGLLLMLGMYCGSMAFEVASAKKELALAKSNYESTVVDLRELKTALTFQERLRQRRDWGSLLRQLSHLPPEVSLTELVVLKGRVRLSGIVTGKQARTAPAQMVIDLKKTFLKNVSLVSKKPVSRQSEAWVFEISADDGITGVGQP